MPVLQLDSIRDTKLWKRLDQGFSGRESELSQKIALDLLDICRETSDRMKSFPSLHPQYTLHDEAHLLRVTELMSRIMPEEVADRLNPVEIMLLILAAHFHDQGMVLEHQEIENLRHDPQFILFQDNWAIIHPNLRDIEQRLGDKNLSREERSRCHEIQHELRAALLTDYVRQTHGERSATFVRSTYGQDRRWEIMNSNVAEFAARLCRSHVRPTHDLTPTNGFRYDEAIGTYRVNMPYLGVILRLADILDLDRDRTPDSLYRTIHFQSPVSLREWEKHRSVDGWVIQPTIVQFTMRCEHPEYQRAALQFMDWIDRELADAQAICHGFPASVAGYALALPLSVDRSRIEPKDRAYIYSDLEFSLSRDEIVKLLMTDQLYGGPWLCVRELLQNSLDALRYRQAVIRRDLNVEWPEGKVELTHDVDSAGYEVVKCTDNGIGMDRTIVEKFLTRAGRSYYRSPEFEQERESFRATGFDFDPCAKFGIGFMSSFMLGDRINIQTRRDYGHNRGPGEPLLVEINGLSGIVVLRSGPEGQSVGTTIEIIGRRKPGFLDKFEDRVRLISVLRDYALATEFPIKGTCSIPELSQSIEIPATVTVRRTGMEKLDIPSITIDIPFSQVNPLLAGSIRASFLADDTGQPVLQTSGYEWTERGMVGDGYQKTRPNLALHGDYVELNHVIGDATCIDGIYVAGEPGRERNSRMLGGPGDPFHCGRLSHFLIDIRGAIKPPLTPARRPPEPGFDERKGLWLFIQDMINKSEGKIFENLGARLGAGKDPELFWKLALIYTYRGFVAVPWIRSGYLWNSVEVPLMDESGRYEWIKFSELAPLKFATRTAEEESQTREILLQQRNGKTIKMPPSLQAWAEDGKDQTWNFTLLAASMGTVAPSDIGLQLEFRDPDRADSSPFEFLLSLEHRTGFIAFLPYSSDIRHLLAAHLPIQIVNRNHPLAQVVLEAKYLEQKNDLQEFALAVTNRLSRAEPFDHPSYDRWQKKIGHLYRNISWESIDPSLHPPYKVYTERAEMVEISHETFKEWANRPLTASD